MLRTTKSTWIIECSTAEDYNIDKIDIEARYGVGGSDYGKGFVYEFDDANKKITITWDRLLDKVAGNWIPQ